MRIGKITHTVLAAAFAVLPVITARAVNLALNHSFESEEIASNSVKRVAAIDDWLQQPNPGPGLISSNQAFDGAQYAVLYGPGSTPFSQQALNQTITATLNQTVGIAFSVRGGSQNDWAGGPSGFSATWLSSSSGGIGNWTGSSSNLTLQIQVNGVSIGQVVNPGTEGWVSDLLFFVSSGSDVVRFVNLGDPAVTAASTVLSLDNIVIEAIPEPTVGGFLLGASFLLALRRRSRA